jgi:hypothetical protein
LHWEGPFTLFTHFHIIILPDLHSRSFSVAFIYSFLLFILFRCFSFISPSPLILWAVFT